MELVLVIWHLADALYPTCVAVIIETVPRGLTDLLKSTMVTDNLCVTSSFISRRLPPLQIRAEQAKLIFTG